MQGRGSPEFSQEYQQAVAGLNHFISVDTKTLQTLKDTSFATSLVGYHLRTIIRERGKSVLHSGRLASVNPKDNPTEQSLQETIYVEHSFDVQYESGNPRLTLMIAGSNVRIETYTESGGISQREYNVTAPASQALPLSTVNQEAREFHDIFIEAIQWHNPKEGSYTAYIPVFYPNTPEHQQGYTKLLQEVVREVLDVIPQL